MSKNDFMVYVRDEVFRGIPGIAVKPMFSGFGFYQYGLIFAIIAQGKLFFKVGEKNRKNFEEKGSQPFVYNMKGKEKSLGYWELPAEVMENPGDIQSWIDASLAVHSEKSRGKRKSEDSTHLPNPLTSKTSERK